MLRPLRLLLCLLLLLGLLPGHAQPLAVDPALSRIDAWPALTVLADTARAWTLDDARLRRDRFAPPSGPRGNLGPRSEAVWLHLPLRAVGERPSRWVVEFDYAPLNRVDVHVLRDGEPIAHHLLGSEVAFDRRPIQSRTHTLPLELRPQSHYELYVRVQTRSAMLVPVTLHRAKDFVAHESARQLMHGLLFGVMATLLAYAAITGFGLRERIFAWYSLMLAGIAVFLTFYTGLGQQYLWHELPPWLAQVGPQAALVAVVGGSLFVPAALGIVQVMPRLTLALRLTATAAALVVLASAAGLLEYRATQLAASLLGPLPVVLALPAALLQAYRGERAARWVVLGWAFYGVGMLVLVAMLRGWLPADFWVQHLFQFTAVAEALAWMQVLALRVQTLRRAAESAQSERQLLQQLAHSDALTGLPNRRGLESVLAAALPRAGPAQALAVYLLDLDGFKQVNDRHGHEVGDELLVQVGQRLRGQLRGGDVVGRFGGDEFVVVSAGLPGEADAQRLGSKLIAALGEPFFVAGRRCEVGATIGFALAPHDGSDPLELLRQADAAMYAGKRSGRTCLRRDDLATAPSQI